jgi:MMP 1-O-methyltransferase
MDQRDRARRAASPVEGWLSDAQGIALFEAAAQVTGPGAIVEIGSWKGRSTIWLAHGARVAGRSVFAIDPHTASREDASANTYDEFSSNIRGAGVEDVVTPLVMSSADAAAHVSGAVEVLFIDGDHSDEGSRIDAAIWLPKLAEGGVVLMHDVITAGYTGPRRVFQRQICWSSEFSAIRRVGSMGIARRVARRSRRDAGWGVIAGFLLYLLDAKRLLRKARGK